MSQMVRIEKKPVQMIAHQGLNGLARESTCAAFVATGNRGCFGIGAMNDPGSAELLVQMGVDYITTNILE